MRCTIDASVFVASARDTEAHHKESLEFLRSVQKEGDEVICPTLVLPECSAAIARQTEQPILAEKLLSLIETLPKLLLVSLDIGLGRKAAQIAATHRLRGADSVYTAVAEALDATLVTLDAEMLKGAPAIVKTMTPLDWLEWRKQEKASQQQTTRNSDETV